MHRGTIHLLIKYENAIGGHGMKNLPTITKENGVWQLIVDGEPFIALGGEIHNSSASDAAYMEKMVWPAVEELKANFLLVPVSWEQIEKTEGSFDFSGVDELLVNARRRNLKLGLLWMGMWKGPDSLFIPLWLKRRLGKEDFQRAADGKLIRQLSPFCDKVYEADLNAYRHLMEHLRDFDAQEQTVLLMQVENEPGTWFHDRDHSQKAEAAYVAEVPAEIAVGYGVTGSWEQAFGESAADMFMNWIISGKINRLAKCGKEIYALPTFTNCVPGMGFLKVAGGPSAEHADFWKKFAPDLDVLTPNVYAPNYEEIISSYQREDNPLMIPETGIAIDCASRALYTVGRGGLMFSPFGIEDCFPQDPEEYKVRLMGVMGEEISLTAGRKLRDTYCILKELYPEILQGLKEKRLYTLLQRPEERFNRPKAGFGGMVSFEGGDSRTIDVQNYRITFRFGYSRDPEDNPLGAAILIERGEGHFLFVGINLCMEVQAMEEGTEVFVDDFREYVYRNGHLTAGRILNGDERNALAAGAELTVFTLELAAHR